MTAVQRPNILFKIHTMTDTGMQYHDSAYVSVLEEYNGHWKSGHILNILHIIHILIHYLSTSAWLDQCQSAIVYERRETKQVLYVIPVSSILGRLPLVPVGATGTRISRLSWSFLRQIREQW